MKKFIKSFLTTLLVLTIVFNFVLAIKTNANLHVLIFTQRILAMSQTYYNEINAERNKLLEEYVVNKIAELDKKEVKPSFEYLQNVTVRVLNILDVEKRKASIGTGTIIKVTEDFTYILTNKHVAPIDAKIVYVEKNKKRYKAEVIKNGVTRDLSLIKIVGKIPNTEVVKGLSKIKEQEKVYSVGMYMGFYDIYTEGTVAGWWKDSRLMNMPCLNGCSGSGVFDKDGNMVAVLYAGTKYNLFGFDTAKSICVPFIGIYAFLEEIL